MASSFSSYRSSNVNPSKTDLSTDRNDRRKIRSQAPNDPTEPPLSEYQIVKFRYVCAVDYCTYRLKDCSFFYGDLILH